MLLLKLSSDLWKVVLEFLRADTKTNASSDILALLLSSKKLYEHLTEYEETLTGSYGRLTLKRYGQETDPFTSPQFKPSLLTRASQIVVKYDMSEHQPNEAFMIMVRALKGLPNVELDINEATDVMYRPLVFETIGHHLTNLRKLCFSAFEYEERQPIVLELADGVLFPHLTHLELSDWDWWPALRDRVPNLESLELSMGGDSKFYDDLVDAGGYIWEDQMKSVPKLKSFAVSDHDTCGIAFGSVVMTADSLKKTTPHLTQLDIGQRWYLEKEASPKNMMRKSEQPHLDPDIFKQITHLKLTRFVWYDEDNLDDPEEDALAAETSVSRGILIGQLQHLKALHLRHIAEIWQHGLRGFEQMTALEELTIHADAVAFGSEDESDGEGDIEEEESDEDDEPALDLSPLTHLTRLRHVKVAYGLPVVRASVEVLKQHGCQVEHCVLCDW